MTTSLRVGIDIGGTFTDVVCQDGEGRLSYFKTPTTRKDESIAVLSAIDRLLKDWNVGPEAIKSFAHGTTVATNAIVEKKGAKVGVITTKGFRDVLEIGRQMRHQVYETILKPETPIFLAPRQFRAEVRERIGFDGEVLVALDHDDVLRAATSLVDSGVEAIAICFLFSFVNPDHETSAKKIINKAFPHIPLSVSHEVDPSFREYERTVVSAFDAYVKPVIDNYLLRIERGLVDARVAAPLQVMQSRGGLMASPIARQRPVRLFLSGPAAGVVGAQISGRAAGVNDLITVDIGGTTSDIALINNGKVLVRSTGEIEGYPVRVPMVDVNSIGAGGGSIAWLDIGSGLRVGPRSAGSEPGPACFDRGGVQPTVTDASIVLGYIDPSYFAGGALTLNPEAAVEAISKHIAIPMGISVERAALGIHRIVNAQMAEGIRSVSTRRGLDPRGFALMPLGGGGALHATALAEELGIRKVIVPRFPGVLAAAGLLAAPVEHESMRAFGRPIESTEVSALKGVLDELDVVCDKLMALESLDGAEVIRRYSADVCYIGQGYWLEVPLDLGATNPLGDLFQEFQRLHSEIYGHSDASPARIVNLRALHSTAGREEIGTLRYEPDQQPRIKGRRSILLPGSSSFEETIVYRRESLPVGFCFDGPAVIEQQDTTAVVGKSWQAKVDKTGTLVIELQGATE